MSKDWRNEKEYDYMDSHTPDLWAWEFLRRNPDYIKDWESALSAYKDKKKAEIPHMEAVLRNEEKWHPLGGILNAKAFYLNELTGKTKTFYYTLLRSFFENLNSIPDYLPFEDGRSKWSIYFNDIINPDIDIPTPYEDLHPIFYTYNGNLYSEKDFNMLPDLLDTERVAVFDLMKPILQQLGHIMPQLEMEQRLLKDEMDRPTKDIRNKKVYWKDNLRIFDAFESYSDINEIASIIFEGDKGKIENTRKKVNKRHDGTKEQVSLNYRNILQPPAKIKKR